MIIKFRKKVIFDSSDFKQLNDFIMNSTYDKMKNIKQIKSFPLNILTSDQELTIIKFLKLLPKFKNNVPNIIEYWTERGWSTDDAMAKVLEFKKLQKNGIYEKIPKEKRLEYALNANSGRIKQIKEMQQTGEYYKTNPTNIEYYLSKGMSEKDAKEALKQRQSTFSKIKMINKWGEEEGLKKVDSRNKKWFSSLKKNNDWDALSKSKAVTLEKLIKKYGEEEGIEKYNNWKTSVRNTKENFILRYGVEQGHKKWEIYKSNVANRSNSRFYSVEACNFFHNFTKKLEESDILFYTASERCDKEYFIIDDNSNIFFYDFVIPSKKIIIEYHGTHIHPNPKWEKEKWDSWKHAFQNKNAFEAREFDLKKKSLAESKGFQVLEIWNDDGFEQNYQTTHTFIFSDNSQSHNDCI